MRSLAIPLALAVWTAAAPAAAPAAATPAPAAPVIATQAVVEKIGQGDRLFLAGDHRGALFAYQDAVYLQPQYVPARVRLGRAYLALRYPAQATAQAEAAIAQDPGNADARKLLDEARSPASARGQVTPLPPIAAGSSTARAADAPARAAPKAYRLPPEPDAGPARVAVAPAAAGAAAVAAEPASPSQAQAAAQHYRTGIEHLQNREWAQAVAALSEAILADPRLAVAHSARGSAQFGLGKYREAAQDYEAAMALDRNLGTPIYGLAECHRVLGDGKKAAELYDRYARSGAPDVRDDLKEIAAKRAQELR
jgi:tetratricopeptide (TPR) repeat protein